MSFSFIKDKLAQQQALNLYRRRSPLTIGTGRYLQHQDKQYLNFSSNDYLGLSQHKDIAAAFKQGVDTYGTGSASSSLITGYSCAHQQLEEELAEWLGAPRCLLYSTGFSANSGVLSALGQQTASQYFLDKLSHASLIDGAFNAKAKTKRFAHNDVAQLAKQLSTSTAKDTLIVAEGVYSMDGDTAPLNAINDLALSHNANVLVDDAHGVGVLAEDGSGTLSAQQVAKSDHIIQMVTFGKALATQGAAVLGSEELIEYLINHSRDYIYSTAMPAANAVATLASVKVCKREHWRREKIAELTRQFKQQLDSSIEITDSQSSIIGVLTGSEENALCCQRQLKNLGFWLSAIRPPTVEKGKSRLRVTITVNHNAHDINNLANAINEVLGKCLQNN
ncbi:aminotransferase class I/II-fold pyridoxal phosphate-dependent enzyme [Thalassotalea sp. ND16A]|uniref:aminotransferase class I/II-fold pyridoxal phosphate-dependent enzyme n=1 Tax=Thalassotalea sp. ND16A TaxID=1535422 RepID=UPI00051A7B37|nr:8-amino-7-oxononanoate synthase [Thalassotalea sp. ND16A]KGJ96491.1 8-amino-7-oxononanoate synthase [Thalassotalea sp. ND16A]